MNNIYFRLNDLAIKVIMYTFMLGTLIIVIEDMPLREYIIDPAIYVIAQHPSLMAYLLQAGIILMVVNELIRIYETYNKYKRKKE